MKRLGLGILMIGCLLILAGPAAAFRWPADMSYRVQTMGGSTLGIEDETTDLTLFNHENLAGLALNSRLNRIDAAVFYNGDVTDTPAAGPNPQNKVTNTDIELTRPGGEYRGLTYWLDSNFVARVGIEGMLLTSVASVTGIPDETFNFSALGGGLSLAYRMEGLALGAGVSYTGAGGSPASLTGQYNFYGPSGGTTSKFNISGTNLDWGVGAGYVIEGLGADSRLSLGVQVSADDERPNLAGIQISGTGFNPLILGDYSTVIDIAGSVTSFLGTSALANKMTFAISPMVISGEAILNLGKMLQAGVLIDEKTKTIQSKTENTNPFSTTTTDYKLMSESLFSLTPIVRANLALGDDLALLPGVKFSTFGSGTLDFYTASSATSSYKSSSTAMTDSLFGIAVGLQAMKQLQLAIEYDTGSTSSQSTGYDANGNSLGTGPTFTGSNSAIHVGAEYWLIPLVAIRAGYAMFSVTPDTSASPVVKQNTSSITFGGGLALPQGLNLDLMVKLDSFTTDPAPTPNPTHTATGVFLGGRIPL